MFDKLKLSVNKSTVGLARSSAVERVTFEHAYELVPPWFQGMLLESY